VDLQQSWPVQHAGCSRFACVPGTNGNGICVFLREQAIGASTGMMHSLAHYCSEASRLRPPHQVSGRRRLHVAAAAVRGKGVVPCADLHDARVREIAVQQRVLVVYRAGLRRSLLGRSIRVEPARHERKLHRRRCADTQNSVALQHPPATAAWHVLSGSPHEQKPVIELCARRTRAQPPAADTQGPYASGTWLSRCLDNELTPVRLADIILSDWPRLGRGLDFRCVR